MADVFEGALGFEIVNYRQIAFSQAAGQMLDQLLMRT
jgi:hypothetical protein